MTTDQDRPTDPPEGTIDVPDGTTVINDLPHDLAQELIEDELQETHKPSGRSYIAEIVRLTLESNLENVISSRSLMLSCIRSAGESEYAIKKWMEMQE